MAAEQVVLHVLSPEQRARKFELEEQVHVGLRATVMSARAIRALRDERLYLDHYPTFEDYARATFGLSRQRLYQLIDFATVAEEAGALGIEVSNERLARALKVVPVNDFALTLEVARAVSGKDTPSSADVAATATVLRDMDDRMVEHPQTRQMVPLDSLPPAQKVGAVARAVQSRSRDLRDLQGSEEERPFDWLERLRVAHIPSAIYSDDRGYTVELTLPGTEEVLSARPARNVFDAVRHAKAQFGGLDALREGSTQTPDSAR